MATVPTARIHSLDVKAFDLPLMEGMVVTDTGSVSTVRAPTAQSLEALHQQAYDEGHALGYAEGRESGAGEIAEKVAVLAELIDTLAEPLRTLDGEVVGSTAELAILIAKHLVRRELKIDPGEIVAVVRDTMQHLPVATRNPRIRMHPDDIDIVESALVIGEESRSWRMQPDPLVTRGGCIVETDASRIDASVESRLAAIVSKMFGGEREGDRAE
ncbi:MAG: flagellar assembly protein FliH [Gammaproteobacteria bacterium]|jgi:flagellar assembly protein FliH